ncbi:MAG: hypothetical protein RR942_15045 [Romboutsia sp.]
MQLYRVKELISLATTYMQIGYKTLDALIKAERELGNENNTYGINI